MLAAVRAVDAANARAATLRQQQHEATGGVAAAQARIAELQAERTALMAAVPQLEADAVEARRAAASLQERRQV
jgi:hypothetical protein